MTSRNMTDVAVLIVTYKRNDLLSKCLESIERQYGAELQIVVVDNGAEAAAKEICDRWQNVSYIKTETNCGFAGGNNIGWKTIDRKYVVLVNNDTEFCGDALSPVLRYMDSHEEFAAAQGTLVCASNPELTDSTGNWFSPLWILAPAGRRRPLAEAPAGPVETFAVGGAFCALRKESVDSAGGLFYDHFYSYYEDIDLCHRLWLSGYKCAYVPSPHVMHVGGGTSGKVNWSLVLERYYRNIFFSVLTCFGVYGLCRFLPVLTGLCLGQSLVALCRGRPGVLLSHLRNVVRFWRERKLIAVTRRAVRSREVRSDREIIRIAVRRQPWTYYKELMTR